MESILNLFKQLKIRIKQLENNKLIMAGIDKTYGSWDQYIQLIEWCEGKSFTLPNGVVIKPSNYIYTNWYDEFKDKENKPDNFPFWNTPTYLDIWLIRNCPLDFIQNRLKEQYISEYDEIKNYCSIYDTYQRNGLGKTIHYSIVRKPTFNYKSKKCNWLIEIEDTDINWDYDSDHDYWSHPHEAVIWNSNVYHMRNFNLKKLYRKIKKWNLPTGLTIRCIGRYVGQEYIIKTK